MNFNSQNKKTASVNSSRFCYQSILNQGAKMKFSGKRTRVRTFP